MEIIDCYISDNWAYEVSICGIILKDWCDIFKISHYGSGVYIANGFIPIRDVRNWCDYENEMVSFIVKGIKGAVIRCCW